MGNSTTGIHYTLPHHQLKPMDLEFEIDLVLEAPTYMSGTYTAHFEYAGTKHEIKGTAKVEATTTGGTTVLYTSGGSSAEVVYSAGTWVARVV